MAETRTEVAHKDYQELLDTAKDLIHEAKLHDFKYCNDALNKLESAIQRVAKLEGKP